MRTAATPCATARKRWRKKVQDNPLGALLIAGGIGFALAMLMTRPPRRPPQRWRITARATDTHPAERKTLVVSGVRPVSKLGMFTSWS